MRSIIYVVAFLICTPAAAQQVTSYEYDAKGRLVRVARTGGSADPITSSYTYDAADNRQRVVVTSGQTAIDCDLSIVAHWEGGIVEARTAYFWVTKSGPSCPTQVTVAYTSVNGTAKAGTHFPYTEGTLSFASSVTELPITVKPYLGDYSTPLTFSMRLSSATTGVTISQATATFRILDD